MSPEVQKQGRKIVPSNNLYTVLLAFAFGITLAVAAFVAYKCFFQYDAIFKVP